jgi:hypothetical protein
VLFFNTAHFLEIFTKTPISQLKTNKQMGQKHSYHYLAGKEMKKERNIEQIINHRYGHTITIQKNLIPNGLRHIHLEYDLGIIELKIGGNVVDIARRNPQTGLLIFLNGIILPTFCADYSTYELQKRNSKISWPLKISYEVISFHSNDHVIQPISRNDSNRERNVELLHKCSLNPNISRGISFRWNIAIPTQAWK